MTERSWVRIPPGAGLFSSSLSFSVTLIYQLCALNQVPYGGATLLVFPGKNGCLTVQLEAKQALIGKD